MIKYKNITYSIIIFFLAFILKYIYFLYSDGFTRIPIEDSAAYYNLGKEIFENGYLSDNFLAGRPPLLPSIIFIFFNFINEDYILGSLRIFFIFITSFVPIIFYFLCQNLGLTKLISFFISLIILIYPPFIYYSSFLLTENLASLLIALIIYFMSLFSKTNKKNMLIIVLAFSFSLLTFTRSIFVALPFFIFFFYLISLFIKKKNLRYFGKFSLLIFCYLVFISPWALLNKFKHDELIITTNRLGYMLYLSNWDLNNKMILQGQYEKSIEFLDNVKFARENYNLNDESEYLRNLALKEIIENFTLYPKIISNRLLNTLNSRPNPYKSNLTVNDIIMLIWIPILMLFFKHIISNKLDYFDIISLILIMYVFLTSLPFWGTPRFRYPIDNLIIFFALKELFLVKYKLK